MNKTLRIISVAIICMAGLYLVEKNFAESTKGIGIILLTTGLIGAALLLATDIITKKHGKIKISQARPLDYLTIFFWILTLVLAFNQSFVNRFIHKILDIERNLLVFEVTNWFIIVMFLIAITTLTVCLFKFNRSRNRQYPLKFVVPIIFCAILTPAALTPVDSFSAGCPGERIRLSIVNGGQQKIGELRKQAQEHQKEKQLNTQYTGLAEGCSIEPLYELYIL